MGEGSGGRRVGQVVRRNVDCLHDSNRAVLRGGDALLHRAHFCGERRLIAHGRGNTAEERGHFRARLREAEDVVDEKQHVLVPYRGNIRRRSAQKAHAGARSRRFVHLPVNQRAFRSGG